MTDFKLERILLETQEDLKTISKLVSPTPLKVELNVCNVEEVQPLQRIVTFKEEEVRHGLVQRIIY
tara:strand:+ start:606 stop:803 length:198 start_codon:yes stop_codon:yes gene_type:complete